MQLLSLLTLLATISVAIAKRPNWRELDGYSFERFVEDFKLSVAPGSTDYVIKKELFLAELARVRSHNARNKPWKEGINKFSAMTVQEKKAFLGRSKRADQLHKPKHAVEPNMALLGRSVSDLPHEKDWRDANIMTAVKDQGHCGSCWAFSSTAVVESHVALSTGYLFDLSVQQMTACAPNPDSCGGTGGCAGSTSELAFDYVADSGLYEEYQWGYSSYYGTEGDCVISASANVAAKITGYVQLPSNNYTALMNAVATVGPIVVSVDASSWSAYESGIFDGCDQETPDIDHAVVLAGYGEDEGQKYWLIRNSWAPTWGENGYIRLARVDKEEERCGMDVTPQDGVACAGDTDPEKVCGTCGVVFDSAYPVGASV